jgi:hypothetical protein
VHHRLGSGRQSGATLGAARVQHPAATLGGHAGTKPMSALAVQITGLESLLHDGSSGRQIKAGLRFLVKIENLPTNE